MRTTRSKSASRLPPFSLILKRISPSCGIHSSSVFGQPVVDARADVRRVEGIAGADRMEHRHAGARRGGHVAIEVLAFERRSEIVRQVAAHECGAVRFVAAPPERFAVRVVDGGVERAGDDQRAQLRDRDRQSPGSRESGGCAEIGGSRVRNKSTGCPCSSHAAVTEAHESASARIAPSPASWSAAGKAHALPSVIDPNPHASRPEPVRTRQLTFRSVTRSTDRPPN